MKQFFVRRWFLITMLTLLLVGIWNGPRLNFLAEYWQIRSGIVATVLFLMALPLEARTVWDAIRRPIAPLLAVVMNLGILPLFAWLISLGLTQEFAAGLAVAAATPCTLASAAVWTRRAGGNDATALLVTVITNAICFVVTPLWLVAMTGHVVEIDVPKVIVRLGMLVVFPMMLAQLIRLIPRMADWASRHKIALGVPAQFGVLSMIFLGSIRTGYRLFDSEAAQVFHAVDVVLMIGAVLVVHLGILASGMSIAGLLGLARGDRIAVGIAGSQKTLMVGLTVAMDCGITILPMVVYHVGQLIVDTMIADRLREGQASDKSSGGKPPLPATPGPETQPSEANSPIGDESSSSDLADQPHRR